MRSRKSIFKKGIVFVLSFFAFAIFSFTKVSAACEVSFNDNSQYLTLAGDISKWSDSGLKSTGCDVTIKSLTINGGQVARTTFIPSSAGHYTVGYNYTYNDGTKDINGVIYRYVRVLNSNLETSNNYSIVKFDGFDDTSVASVIDSFLVGEYYFANFVVHSNSTYVVIKNSLGKLADGGTVELKDPINSFVAKKVIKSGNNYYIIGNNSEGNGIFVQYQITVENGIATVSQTSGANYTSSKSIYNGAYLDGETLYIAGQSNDGYPIIDKYESESTNSFYKHTVLGAYNSVLSKNNTVYGVGYTKANSTISSGLYTYISTGEDPVHRTLINDADTVFNDIVMYNNQNIIVGRSEVNSINANNVLAATNTRQGFNDGIILRVSSDGQSVTGAYMLGGNVHDEFTTIKLINGNEYVVVGSMNDGTSSLVYRLDAGNFEVSEDVTSSSDVYKINGIANWDYGYAYYGEINANSILGVYYSLSGTEKSDALFISLDNRVFEDYATIPFTTSEAVEHKYCDYPVRFGLSSVENKEPYYSIECNNDDSAVINVTTVGTTNMRYEIDAKTGVKIIIYRLIKVTEDPEPINLNSSTTTGILKWYVYNRTEVITYANRAETTDFNYIFGGDVHGNETIEDMIEYYMKKGNTSAYQLQYVENEGETHKTFKKSDQTTAAFATIEYAKMFAYYQEFSRIVRIDGSVSINDIGAIQYSDIIIPGTSYYVYYIDYRGNNASNSDVTNCRVTTNAIGNCTAKGGYAFPNLNSIKKVIENFLIYNNFFVSTRNTIYNGSIAPSEIPAYTQNLNTGEYVKSLGFANAQTQLNFNIEDNSGTTSYYNGSGKTIYFGGTLSGNTMYHPLMKGSQTVSSVTSNGVTYYEGSSAIFFTHNACYKVYYSNNKGAQGTPRYFCLDTTAPVIEYKKDSSDTVSTQAYPSMNGSESWQPLYIESDFKITDLIDLDDYAFIYVNGNRYPIQCEPYNSEQCLNDVEKYIKQTFRYDSSNPRKLQTIQFSDRLSNTNTFYFVIGTLAPSVSVENETEDSFTLVIDFYKTNPIDIFQASVSYQSCVTESAGNCYVPFDPDDEDEDIAAKAEEVLDINFDLDEFNTAVTNYIYAVSYRDGQNTDLNEFEIISAQEGIYTIDGMNYIIENGYFVEYKGYEESYLINSENIFEYKGDLYAYDALSSLIQKVILDSENHYVSDGSDPINLINNTFQFTSGGKLYTVVSSEEKLSIEALPQSYEIDGSNRFSLNNVIYTVDYESETLSFANPEIEGLKRIKIDFYRTTLDNQEQAGVKIPKTVAVLDKNNIPVVDELTGREIYTIIDEELHFNVVDGVYTFMISHDFAPGVDSVETKINVDPLELNAGYVQYIDGLEVVQNKIVEYDTTYDEGKAQSTTLFVTSLVDQFRYPLAAEDLATSNLSSYQNTHFLDRAVYFSYPTLDKDDNSVLIIRVYDKKNSYGLPSTDNATACSEVIIFGDIYEGKVPITSFCSTSTGISFENLDSQETKDKLEKLGIYKLSMYSSGFFALSGENIFYDIYLKAFKKDNNSIYQPSAVTANKSFYIDTISPKDETVDVYVYDSTDDSKDSTKVFELVDGIYTLNKTIGSTLNVAMDIDWYNAGTVGDYRENRLLLMTIFDGSASVTCNVFQLINNIDYETDCRNYINVDESFSTSDEFKIVFSDTGTYEVTFSDASGNYVTYSFVIDKTAPNVILTNATMISDNGDEYTLTYEYKNNYYIKSYVKNVKFDLLVEDLTKVTSYCYYFDYGQDTKEQVCPGINEEINISIIMEQYKDIYDYLNNNNSDQNVTLVIWAYDEEGNSGETTPTKVLFWVDYKEPEVSYTSENLNTTVIGNVAAQGLKDTTIAVATGEYSGKDIICDEENGFSFVDYRYTIIPAPYKFVLNCSDVHSTLKDDYPNVYEFDNTMHLKFYEWDGTQRTGIFNFGFSTGDEQARWIYITVEDVVGNESDQYVILPISVIDIVNPFVTKVEKEVDGNRELLSSVNYSYQEGESGNVYVANTKMYVTFSENIAQLLSCKVIVVNKDGVVYDGDCNDAVYGDGYNDGQTFEYASNKIEFMFDDSAITDAYKLIIFTVSDYADLPSNRVVLVIDKLAPTIEFNEDGEEDDTIEYIIQTDKKYDSKYSYATHTIARDDQNAGFGVTVLYTKYSPDITYNNYIYTKVDKKYTLVDNRSVRELGKDYYILIKSSSLVNKECVTDHIIGTDTYCFVKDNQSHYYFDNLLTDESGKVWKDVEVIDSSAIGVYRVAYFVTDYAGNVSNTIYKKVFVNDTKSPDMDIYKTGGSEKLYSSVASNTSTNKFEGKLNQLVGLQGTDSAKGEETKIVLYRCLYTAYETGQCNIDQPLFSKYAASEFSSYKSTFSYVELGTTLTNGVYKAFVYDRGSYTNLDYSNIYHKNGVGEAGKVYTLTHNSAHVYFVVKQAEITAHYTVYGNKNADHDAGNFSYKYNDTNYYKITNSSSDLDVYLVRYVNGKYENVSGTKAIGYSRSEFIPENDQIIAQYFDENNKLIYQITYNEYDVDYGLFLHKTYYMVDIANETIDMCNFVKGKNECDSEDIEIVYEVTSVEAYIYQESGENDEYVLQMVDRYGNYSQREEGLVVDNTPYTKNKEDNKATGINYWFSVPKNVVTNKNAHYFSQLIGVSNTSDIDVTDDKYKNNFNSDFFYAFASKEDAKVYLTKIYEAAIEEQLREEGKFDFYSIEGKHIGEYVGDVYSQIKTEIEKMVFTTYTPGTDFSDSKIMQIAYPIDGIIPLSSNMYKYAYLLETKTLGEYNEYTYSYKYKGEECVVDSGVENQKCIRVELKIVEAATSIRLTRNDNDLVTVTCLMSGGGGTSSSVESGCELKTADPEKARSTYLFIEVEENKYHRNVVYYGITSYTKTTKIEYVELGDYIPLEEFIKYKKLGNSYVEEDAIEKDGEYIWLDSKFVKISSLENTNLLTACTFNSISYDECVFVTYLSRYIYDSEAEKYVPHEDGGYYYNYYTKTYDDEKDAMEKVGTDSTFSDDGKRSEGENGEHVPVKVNVHENLTVNFDRRFNTITNKKMYIELFNSENTSIDTDIFEINAMKSGDGTYKEVYSYSQLIINGVSYNINRFITISKDKKSYKCVLDIDINSQYEISIIDRAGNELKLFFSHSNYIPDVIYNVEDENTTSNATISLQTKSQVASIAKTYVKLYKYDVDTRQFKDESIGSSCVSFTTSESDTTFVSSLILEFKYNELSYCSGIYRVEVRDNHGNTRFKDFVFNPYDINHNYQLDSSKNVYEYKENEVNGVLTNGGFSVEVNSKLYYMIINQYASYSNLNMGAPLNTITLRTFDSDVSLGSCLVEIHRVENNIYSISVDECDGIYTVEVINKFSEDILDLGWTHLEGANQELIRADVVYKETNAIEIDTTAPAGDYIGEELYFNIYVDGQLSETDTRRLIENGQVSYKNKYITIHWGGSKEHSFTYLKYNIRTLDSLDNPAWLFESTGVNYSGNYNASYQYIPASEGEFIFEFMFVDVLGNEDAIKTYQIVVKIETPKVGLFEVGDNPNDIGDQYENNAENPVRVADRTILKCLVEQGSVYVPQICNPNEYTYKIYLNDIDVSKAYIDVEMGINNTNTIISKQSQWLINSADKDVIKAAPEVYIRVVVGVIGKEDRIKTELYLIIDQKAPEISFDGNQVDSTYTGDVDVYIDLNDVTNTAIIYQCDVNPYIDNECKMYNKNEELVTSNKIIGVIENQSSEFEVSNTYSGYFMVIAKDALGNESRASFTLDNQAPTITVTSKDAPIAPNMYSNSNVTVSVSDILSQPNSTFEVVYTPLLSKTSSNSQPVAPTACQSSGEILSCEGKYTLTPIDGVGIIGRSITFYIYKQTPSGKVIINDDLTDVDQTGYKVGEKAYLLWTNDYTLEQYSHNSADLYAPIVSITLDGRLYNSTFDKDKLAYVGNSVTDVGEHTFVITDAAGNRKVIMFTINNTSQVCINGRAVEVKMQGYYDVDNLLIGNEPGIEYKKDDVIIFALPSDASSGNCMGKGLLGYRTLDNENSHYLIDNDKNADLFNKYQYDFVEYGLISSKAIEEIKNIGGTVVVFVVTKDVANMQLGYKVGTNFFMEDPIGWTIIFVSLLGLVWPTCRIFIKKKVKVI